MVRECGVCGELVKGPNEKFQVHNINFYCRNQAYGIKVNGHFNPYGTVYRGSPCGSLKCYCCPFSSQSAQTMKAHVESSHNNKCPVAIQTNMDEKENLGSLAEVAVKRELVLSSDSSLCDASATPKSPIQHSPSPLRKPMVPSVPAISPPFTPALTTVTATSQELTAALSSPGLPHSPPITPLSLKLTHTPAPPLPLEASAKGSSPEGNKCDKCGEYYTDSKRYHERVQHQSVTRIEVSVGKIPISRNAETRKFACPLCNIYSNKDPSVFACHFKNCSRDPRTLAVQTKLLSHSSSHDKTRKMSLISGPSEETLPETASNSMPPPAAKSARTLLPAGSTTYEALPAPLSALPTPGQASTPHLSERRRSTRIRSPSRNPPPPQPQPSRDPPPPQLEPLPSLPTKKRPGRNRHVYEWLVESDGSDNDDIQMEVNDGSAYLEKDEREPDPFIVTIMSKLDLHLVCLPSRDQRHPHRFIACGSCMKGLGPQDAVSHATGSKTTGGHSVQIPLPQKKALREWIVKAVDLHSAQNMPPCPNEHGNPVPFLEMYPGYKCNFCMYCTTKQRLMGVHTGTVPGHRTARTATLQHLFHNRLLFAVQPNRHKEGRGDDEGIDLYSLYAKEYGLNVEDESTASIPFYHDEKEMPVMLQITRWFDHVWRYLKNDNESSEEEGDNTDEEADDRGVKGSNDDGMDEEDEVGGVERKDRRYEERDDDESNDEEDSIEDGADAIMGMKGTRSNADDMDDEEGEGMECSGDCSGDDPDVEMNDSDDDFKSGSDSESEVQTGRKRHRSQPLLRSSKRRKKGGRGAAIGASVFFDTGSNSDVDLHTAHDSEFSESEEEEEEDEEFVDEDVARMQDSSRISKQEQQRWEKRDRLTSVFKAKALHSIHLPGATKEKRSCWYGRKLRRVIIEYMGKIRKKVIRGDIEIRQVLAGNKPLWTPLSSKTSIGKYATILYRFLHAIVVTSGDVPHPSGYTFPLTPIDLVNLNALRNKLQLSRAEPGNCILELHKFIKPLLYPRTSAATSRWNHPIECFIAVYAMREDGVFKEAKDVSSIFSALLYHIRCTIWYEASITVKRFKGDLLKAVQHEAEKNFGSNIVSPFNSCVHYFGLVKFLGANSTLAPTTRTGNNGMLIVYKEVTLDIPCWRNAIKLLITKATQTIGRVCYNQDFGLKHPEHTRDDWSSIARGYSGFKVEPYLPHELALLDAMLHDKDLGLAQLSPNKKSIKVDFHVVQKIMSDFALINTMLALLVFFLCGQPSRTTEFVDAKYSNSNRPRCVFLDDQGTVWIVVRRVKYEGIARREVFLPKKCPPVVSDLLKRYLLIIRPVETELSCLAFGKGSDMAKAAASNYSTFLWVQEGKRMEPDSFRAHVAKFLQNDCECKGGKASVYRNFAVEISRTFFPPNFNDILYDNRARDSARQRGHSATTAKHVYAVEADHLPEMSSDTLLGYGKISELWWDTAGVGSGEPLVPFLVSQERERHQISEIKKEAAELKAEATALRAEVTKMSGMVDEMNQNVQTILNAVTHFQMVT